MDIKEYIASGILEAYVAGELSEEEMIAVDKVANEYPVVKSEIEEIQESLRQYGELKQKKLNPAILTNSLKSIKEDEREDFLSIMEEETEKPSVVRRFPPVWSIAASVLFLISFGLNLFFLNDIEKKKQTIASLQSDTSDLLADINQASQQLDYAELRIAHFLNKDNIHVRMDGEELAPKSYANVFWNKNTNAVFISVDNLPEPPQGHQYQLWAIKPGQAPIDAGIFDHSLLVQELKVIKGNVQAFAVTLEKEGGSPIATVDQTYVKGFLKKS